MFKIILSKNGEKFNMRMKKKRHGGERLSLMSSMIVENPSSIPDNIEQIYGNKNPLRIEIGCGKGDFIRGKSEQERDYNYLAIEKIADVMTIATEKYATAKGLGNLAPNGGWQTPDGKIHPLGENAIEFTKEQIGNVRFCVGDAAELLKDLPDSCVDTIYVNFCDPWKKKGQRKRRLTYISFLNMYSKLLVNGGKFCFKTDNRDLFDFSLEQVEMSNLKLEYKTYDLHASDMNATNIQTEYERNFTEKGFKINMLIAKNEK